MSCTRSLLTRVAALAAAVTAALSTFGACVQSSLDVTIRDPNGIRISVSETGACLRPSTR